jgi:hypothetical protein
MLAGVKVANPLTSEGSGMGALHGVVLVADVRMTKPAVAVAFADSVIEVTPAEAIVVPLGIPGPVTASPAARS